jgi:hypothetical protein
VLFRVLKEFSRVRHIHSLVLGFKHAVALCMTITALQSGKRVTFDETKQEVIAA